MTLIQTPEPWPRTDEALFDVGEPVIAVPSPEFPPESPKIEEPDLTEQMEFSPPLSGATISECGKYRYVLWRKFKAVGIKILWIMLNPSTADGKNDDATIRRLISFGKREGAAEIFVCNLYAYRATKPKELYKARKSGIDIQGPENKEHIEQMMDTCDLCIVGWGNTRAARGRTDKVLPCGPEEMMNHLKMVNQKLVPIKCLGTTKHGHPRHPLFVPAYRKLVPFEYKIKDEGVDF